MPGIKVDKLFNQTVGLLQRAGLAPEAARDIMDHLICAELWGRPSHGVSLRLPKILTEVQQGVGDRHGEWIEDHGSTIVLDGHDGFGLVNGARATGLLLERVGQFRLVAVAVRNSGHTGLMSYYLNRIARTGTVGIAFAHCLPLMAPHGARQPLFGTNPIAFGLPAEPHPIVIDLATSKTSYGELELRARHGQALPPDCAIDQAGQPTTDPKAARDGALLPFGGYKGSALALAVQLLAGPLTGSWSIPSSRTGYGMLLLGLAHDTFQSSAAYHDGVEELLTAYRNLATSHDEPLHLPGQRYHRDRHNSANTEIEISDEISDLLQAPPA